MNRSIIFFLALVSLAFSQSVEVEMPESICENNTDLLSSIANLPQCTAEAILRMITEGLLYSSREFYSFSMQFLTSAPDLQMFCQSYSMLMGIIESFYTIMLMGLGAYYIMNSTNVEGRARSKTWLKNVFYMVIILAFSFNIFGLLLDLNTQLSSEIYSQINEEVFEIDAQLTDLIFTLVFSITLFTGGYVTFVTLVIRYLLIPFLLFIFPFAIFMYFIPVTREWGAFLFKFIALIIFMTTVDAILLLGITSVFDSDDPNFSNPLVKSFGLIIGWGVIGIVNLIIYTISVLVVIVGAFRAIESIAGLLSKMAIMLSFL